MMSRPLRSLATHLASPKPVRSQLFCTWTEAGQRSTSELVGWKLWMM